MATNEVVIKVTADAKGVKPGLKVAEVDARKAGQDAGKAWSDAFKAGAKFEGFAPAVGAGAGALGAVGAAAAASLPAMLALGAAGGVVQLGMDGIKKAAEQAKPAFDQLKKSVSSTFEKQLTKPFAELGNMLPKLEGDMQGVALSVSELISELIGVATSAHGVEDLQQALKGAGSLIKGLTPGVKDFAASLLSMAADVAPNMERLGESIGNVFAKIGAALAFQASEGTMGKAIDNFAATLEGLGSVANSVLNVLIEMGAAAGTGLADMLQGLADGIDNAAPGMTELAAAGGELLTALAPLMPVLGELAGEVFHQLAEAVRAAVPHVQAFAEWCARNEETLKAWVPIIMSAVAAWKAFQLAMKAWKAGSATAAAISAAAEAVGLIGRNADDSEKKVGRLAQALGRLNVPGGGAGGGSVGSGVLQGLGSVAGGALGGLLGKGGKGLLGALGGRAALGAAGAGGGVLGGIMAGGLGLGWLGAKATGNDAASGNIESLLSGNADLSADAFLATFERLKVEIPAKLDEVWTAVKAKISGWKAEGNALLAEVWASFTGGDGGQGLGERMTTALTAAWESVKTTVATWGTDLATSASTLWDQFLLGIQEKFAAVKEWFAQTPYEMGFAIGANIGEFLKWGQETWNQFKIGAETKFSEFMAWLGTIPTLIAEFFTGQSEQWLTWGTETWQAFWDGALLKWEEFYAWLQTIPTLLTEWATAQIEQWTQWGTDSWQAFWTGLQLKFDEFMAWLATVPQLIVTALVELATLLLEQGTLAWQGFWDGVTAVWDTFYAWLQTVPQLIIDTLVELPALLLEQGTLALQGFYDGVLAKWAELQTWFTDLPNLIVTTIGDLSQTLVAAGEALMQGLLDGIKSAYAEVEAFVSGIADGLAAQKGPLTYDRRVMRPNGRALMDGLLWGLKRGEREVIRHVSRMADRIAGAGVVAGFQAGDPRVLSMGSGRGRGGGGGWSRGWDRRRWRGASVVAGHQLDEMRAARERWDNDFGRTREVQFVGNVDGAFATAFQRLVRTGAIRVV